jgi:DeoR family ulaG and ulaABCDEF operon transcriptional repressor
MQHYERRKRLLKLLEQHDSASVPQLASWLDASDATVRRDIATLAGGKLLKRVRGGAAHLARQSAARSALAARPFRDSLERHAASKRAIARRAALECAQGETVIINGGTTTYMMAEFLAAKRLTILTNSFSMASRLLATSDNEVILTGGHVYREQNVILSPFDQELTAGYSAHRMFMSGAGLSLLGLMESDPILLQAESRLIGQAEQLVVLADSSKFERKGGLVLCGLGRVHTVITDTQVSDQTVQLLERSGVKVVAVAPEAPPG